MKPNYRPTLAHPYLLTNDSQYNSDSCYAFVEAVRFGQPKVDQMIFPFYPKMASDGEKDNESNTT